MWISALGLLLVVPSALAVLASTATASPVSGPDLIKRASSCGYGTYSSPSGTCVVCSTQDQHAVACHQSGREPVIIDVCENGWYIDFNKCRSCPDPYASTCGANGVTTGCKYRAQAVATSNSGHCPGPTSCPSGYYLSTRGKCTICPDSQASTCSSSGTSLTCKKALTVIRGVCKTCSDSFAASCNSLDESTSCKNSAVTVVKGRCPHVYDYCSGGYFATGRGAYIRHPFPASQCATYCDTINCTSWFTSNSACYTTTQSMSNSEFKISANLSSVAIRRNSDNSAYGFVPSSRCYPVTSQTLNACSGSGGNYYGTVGGGSTCLKSGDLNAQSSDPRTGRTLSCSLGFYLKSGSTVCSACLDDACRSSTISSSSTSISSTSLRTTSFSITASSSSVTSTSTTSIFSTSSTSATVLHSSTSTASTSPSPSSTTLLASFSTSPPSTSTTKTTTPENSISTSATAAASTSAATSPCVSICSPGNLCNPGTGLCQYPSVSGKLTMSRPNDPTTYYLNRNIRTSSDSSNALILNIPTTTFTCTGVPSIFDLNSPSQIYLFAHSDQDPPPDGDIGYIYVNSGSAPTTGARTIPDKGTPEEAHIFKIDCSSGEVTMNWLGPNSEDHPMTFCGYHYNDGQGELVYHATAGGCVAPYYPMVTKFVPNSEGFFAPLSSSTTSTPSTTSGPSTTLSFDIATSTNPPSTISSSTGSSYLSTSTTSSISSSTTSTDPSSSSSSSGTSSAMIPPSSTSSTATVASASATLTPTETPSACMPTCSSGNFCNPGTGLCQYPSVSGKLTMSRPNDPTTYYLNRNIRTSSDSSNALILNIPTTTFTCTGVPSIFDLNSPSQIYLFAHSDQDPPPDGDIGYIYVNSGSAPTTGARTIPDKGTPEEAHIFKIDCSSGEVTMNWLGPNSEDHPMTFCGYHYNDGQGELVYHATSGGCVAPYYPMVTKFVPNSEGFYASSSSSTTSTPSTTSGPSTTLSFDIATSTNPPSTISSSTGSSSTYLSTSTTTSVSSSTTATGPSSSTSVSGKLSMIRADDPTIYYLNRNIRSSSDLANVLILNIPTTTFTCNGVPSIFDLNSPAAGVYLFAHSNQDPPPNGDIGYIYVNTGSAPTGTRTIPDISTPEEAHIFKIDCFSGEVTMNWLGPDSDDHPMSFCGEHYNDGQGDLVYHATAGGCVAPLYPIVAKFIPDRQGFYALP